MTTRREIIKAGAGLTAILAAGKAPASLVRSMLAARGAIMMGGGKKAPTARDYVQDGLVAMWDGIENAGWGQHDAAATMWKDLVGGFDAVKVGSPTWSDNAGNTNGADNTFLATIPTQSTFINAAKSGFVTIEICLSTSMTWKSRCPFSIEDSDGTRSLYRFVQIFMQADKTYCPAPYNVNSTNFLGRGPVFDNPSGTISCSFGSDGASMYATPSRNGTIGTEGSITARTYMFDPATLDQIGVNNWYVRIGRTHNNSMSAAFHCVRLYSRALTADEIEHNYKIDKRRFNQ